MTSYKIHTPDTFLSMPWRNGLGRTIELHSEKLPQSDNFAWRLSMADVSNDGVFSDFSGYDRTLLLMQGEGLTLEHNKGERDELLEYLQAAHFDGGDKSHATLHNGPISDFNIMTKRDYCSSTVKILKNVRDEEIAITGDVLMIYAPDGAVSIQSNDRDQITLGSKHLLHDRRSEGGKCSVSGPALIIIQIHYKNKYLLTS